MSIMAVLLRFFMMVAVAVSVGLPAPALAAAQPALAIASQDDCHPGRGLTQDDACLVHCLGLFLAPAAMTPAGHTSHGVAQSVIWPAETAPSRWPLPERHPPRL